MFWIYICQAFLFISLCFSSSLQFSSVAMKCTKLFSSNFQTVPHFSTRKIILYGELNEQIKFPRWMTWMTPVARALHGCKLIQKAGNLARNSAPLWLLMGRIIFLASEKTSFAILIGRKIFCTREKDLSLLWLTRAELLYENLRHSFPVSISRVYKL